MAKDYVRRKATPKKTKKQLPKRSFPMLAILIFVVAIAGFSWLLYSIKGSAPEPSPLPASIIPEISSPDAPIVNATPLPEKPQERSYIHELETKEVEVEITQPKNSETRPYQMQCASFRNRDDAESMKATIAFSGLSSQAKRSEGKNGVWYRVVLGPYSSKRKAETDRHKLQKIGIDSCQIWFWNWG